VNLFGPKNPDNETVESIRRLKAWTTEFLGLDENATVLVTELTCTEPGCPPLETVIAVLRPGSSSDKRKMHRAAREMTRADIEQLWSAPDHSHSRKETL